MNGDDFGLAPEVNRGIVRAHREGILTSTSLMVTGPVADEAVVLARETPSLAVGLHLVLVQGRAATPASVRAGLARADASFRESAIPAGMLYFFHPRLRAAVAGEVRAQLEAFRSTGLRLSHVDGHLNIHLHPIVSRALADLAPEFGIPAVRLTRDPLLRGLRWNSRHALRKVFEGVVFRILSARAARALRGLGVVSATQLFGLHQSGACDESYLAHVLANLPPGDTELYLHPAEAATPEMQRLMPGYAHACELAALVSPRMRALIERNGIELATYADLRAPALDDVVVGG